MIVDTSALAVWLGIPEFAECGPKDNCWDHSRIEKQIADDTRAGATLVLPLATLIETGNHVAQSRGDRFALASALSKIIQSTADERAPWAAFTSQSDLWTADHLKKVAAAWPTRAAAKVSIGDYTIVEVAHYYARLRYHVCILTGDQGLKSLEPLAPIPRRHRR